MTHTAKVSNLINAEQVVLFMKGTPKESSCGYSTRLAKILDYIGLDYTTHDILLSDELRKSVKEHTGVRTLPQLFVNGAYVGGSDDIRDMHDNGTLISFFTHKGVATSPDSNKGDLVVGDVSREQIIACSKVG